MTALSYIRIGECIYISECYSTECLGHSLHVILFRANNETYLRVSRSSRQARLGLLRNAKIRFDRHPRLSRARQPQERTEHARNGELSTALFGLSTDSCPPRHSFQDLISEARGNRVSMLAFCDGHVVRKPMVLQLFCWRYGTTR
jgi:prepilin-type processing-associated H-X9-DG protein